MDSYVDGYVLSLGIAAKKASKQINTAGTAVKDGILHSIAAKLRASAAEIEAANALDIAAAREAGYKESFIDRLTLTPARIEGIADAVTQLVSLTDPVGVVTNGFTRPSGLRILRTRVPMGVIGMIYESRPNVTVDAACLCLKSGNACILRGGREAINSNKVLVALMRDAIAEQGLSPDIVQLIEDTSRQSATDLMGLRGYIDVIIPRGGAGLIASVVENARVPVIETGVGNCHIFVDESADAEQAVAIVDNAKTQRPSVCNSVETLLVHKAVATELLPRIKAKLDEHSVELRGCPQTRRILGDVVLPVTEEDYYTEFNDYILAVKVVDGIAEAIAHLEQYSSHHTEAILTGSFENSQRFVREVDAAAVMVNASTRFTDGAEFGLGAEIGISNQKLHARGPMGLMELTTDKYIVTGDGHIRA